MKLRKEPHLAVAPDGVRIYFPYNRTVVRYLNTLPTTQRRFIYDPIEPYWLIDPRIAQRVVDKINATLGCSLTVPDVPQRGTVEVRTLRLEYLGLCRERPGEPEPLAFGMVDGAWNVLIPESVLRSWFKEHAVDHAERSLYTILGVDKAASADEIRGAYRRLAKQWHPDVCKEDGAAERFKAINAAYEVLKDPDRRQRYDIAYRVAQSILRPAPHSPNQYYNAGYRSPLRCGLVQAEGTVRTGTFLVNKIMRWDDIVEHGRTMVSSWDSRAMRVVINWI